MVKVLDKEAAEWISLDKLLIASSISCSVFSFIERLTS